MIIDGLDVATNCGVARIERPGKPSAWVCEAMYSEGDNSEEKAGELGLMLMRRYKAPDNRPDFVAIEMPMRNVMTFKKEGKDLAGNNHKDTINPNALQLSGLAGAAVCILNCYSIPWGLIASKTWRNAYFGKDYTPPKVQKTNKAKTKIWYEDDWKQAAIDLALMQKITLPSRKADQRDAAEAIGIAVAWEKCTFIPERHRQRFLDLRTGRIAA